MTKKYRVIRHALIAILITPLVPMLAPSGENASGFTKYHNAVVVIDVVTYNMMSLTTMTTEVKLRYQEHYYVADIKYTIDGGIVDNGDNVRRVYKEAKLVSPEDFKDIYRYLDEKIDAGLPEDPFPPPGTQPLKYISIIAGIGTFEDLFLTMPDEVAHISRILNQNSINIFLCGGEAIFNLDNQ